MSENFQQTSGQLPVSGILVGPATIFTLWLGEYTRLYSLPKGVINLFGVSQQKMGTNIQVAGNLRRHDAHVTTHSKFSYLM